MAGRGMPLGGALPSYDDSLSDWDDEDPTPVSMVSGESNVFSDWDDDTTVQNDLILPKSDTPKDKPGSRRGRNPKSGSSTSRSRSTGRSSKPKREDNDDTASKGKGTKPSSKKSIIPEEPAVIEDGTDIITDGLDEQPEHVLENDVHDNHSDAWDDDEPRVADDTPLIDIDDPYHDDTTDGHDEQPMIYDGQPYANPSDDNEIIQMDDEIGYENDYDDLVSDDDDANQDDVTPRPSILNDAMPSHGNARHEPLTPENTVNRITPYKSKHDALEDFLDLYDEQDALEQLQRKNWEDSTIGKMVRIRNLHEQQSFNDEHSHIPLVDDVQDGSGLSLVGGETEFDDGLDEQPMIDDSEPFDDGDIEMVDEGVDNRLWGDVSEPSLEAEEPDEVRDASQHGHDQDDYADAPMEYTDSFSQLLNDTHIDDDSDYSDDEPVVWGNGDDPEDDGTALLSKQLFDSMDDEEPLDLEDEYTPDMEYHEQEPVVPHGRMKKSTPDEAHADDGDDMDDTDSDDVPNGDGDAQSFMKGLIGSNGSLKDKLHGFMAQVKSELNDGGGDTPRQPSDKGIPHEHGHGHPNGHGGQPQPKQKLGFKGMVALLREPRKLIGAITNGIRNVKKATWVVVAVIVLAVGVWGASNIPAIMNKGGVDGVPVDEGSVAVAGTGWRDGTAVVDLRNDSDMVAHVYGTAEVRSWAPTFNPLTWLGARVTAECDVPSTEVDPGGSKTVKAKCSDPSGTWHRVRVNLEYE